MKNSKHNQDRGGFTPQVIIIALLIAAIGSISVGKEAIKGDARYSGHPQETIQEQYERISQTDYIGALIAVATAEGRNP